MITPGLYMHFIMFFQDPMHLCIFQDLMHSLSKDIAISLTKT